MGTGASQTQKDMGLALYKTGQTAKAIVYFRRALKLSPGKEPVMNNLAWILVTSDDPEVRDPVKAVRLAEQLGRGMANHSYDALDTMGAAYASAVQYDKAVRTAEQAVQSATFAKPTDTGLLHQLRSRLRLYRRGQSCRESALP